MHVCTRRKSFDLGGLSNRCWKTSRAFPRFWRSALRPTYPKDSGISSIGRRTLAKSGLAAKTRGRTSRIRGREGQKDGSPLGEKFEEGGGGEDFPPARGDDIDSIYVHRRFSLLFTLNFIIQVRNATTVLFPVYQFIIVPCCFFCMSILYNYQPILAYRFG